jgi:thiol-disulfide isomerase/thioredoxin
LERRNAALAVALVLIAAAILYLEPLSPDRSFAGSPVAPGSRADVNREKAQKFEYAREISAPSGFINADNVTIGGLIGKKVVLVDFWTYSCINCVRTIPYLNMWYGKYRGLGLEIIGVHSPEFQFEHKIENVRAAVAKYGIKYPVVLDNGFSTWGAYNNRYWPAHYLVDIDGFIVESHFGEGGHEETEGRIQALLRERNEALGLNLTIPDYIGEPTDAVPVEFQQVRSPETYFGAARNGYLGNGMRSETGRQTLKPPDAAAPNMLYLSGDWDFADQYAQNAGPAGITYRYTAKNVYLVASADSDTEVEVTLDGRPLADGAGADVTRGRLTVGAERMYAVVEGRDYGTHTLELKAAGPGIKAYTFTFG